MEKARIEGNYNEVCQIYTHVLHYCTNVLFNRFSTFYKKNHIYCATLTQRVVSISLFH